MERGRSAITTLRILVDEIGTDIKNAEGGRMIIVVGRTLVGEPAHCALTFATAAILEHFGRWSTARSWRSPCPSTPTNRHAPINTHLALVADRFGYQAAQEIAR